MSGLGGRLPKQRSKPVYSNPALRNETLIGSLSSQQPDWRNVKKTSTPQPTTSKVKKTSTPQTGLAGLIRAATPHTPSNVANRMNQAVTPPSLTMENHNPSSERGFAARTEHASSELSNTSPRGSSENSANENVSLGLKKKGIGKRGRYKGVILDKLTDGKKNKLKISIPPGEYFRPVGDNVKYLASWIGYCVRSTVGIPIHSWKHVETVHLTQMVTMVTDYFEITEESPPKWKIREEAGEVMPDPSGEKVKKFVHHCTERMQYSHRKWRERLHSHYKLCLEWKVDPSLHKPKGLDGPQWQAMINLFKDSKFKEKSEANAKSRDHVKIFSRTGPTPFQQTVYTLMDGETGKMPLTSEVWIKQHAYETEGEDPRWVRDEAREIYEEITAREMLPRNDDEPPLTSEDILAEILGTRSGQVNGHGSGFKTRKRVHVSSDRSEEVKKLKDELHKLRDDVKEMDKLKEEIKEMNKLEEERKEMDKLKEEEMNKLREEMKQFQAFKEEAAKMRSFMQHFEGQFSQGTRQELFGQPSQQTQGDGRALGSQSGHV